MSVDELVVAMRRSGATTQRARLAEAAYLIVCLAEQNTTLQTVGFPPTSSKAAAHHAITILDELLPGPDQPPEQRP